jgi:CRP/FNR family transcriptional regulator, cyclic AMP receptor protein
MSSNIGPGGKVPPEVTMPRHPGRASQPPDPNDVPMSEALRALAARAEPRLYGKGRVLIQEGSIGNTLFIILSGRLRAYSVSDDGARRVTYGEYLPGEFLGEMSLDGGERSASVEAVEPSWCVQIVRPTLERHIAEYPAFAFELLGKVIRRARAATLGLRAVALNDVYGRVAWLLNDRAVTMADGSRIVGPITHRAMAELLACGRPMVSRVMKELEVGGYIRRLDAANYQILRALPPRF